jgi:hypothetical protein
MVMTSPAASGNVPEEYWTECLHEALIDSLKEFNEHKEHISKEAFINDFSKCLVSFAIKGLGS